MNVYDFDKTIYRGDSTVDFYLYCLARKPWLIVYWPVMGYGFLLYLLGQSDKTGMKQYFYCFLRGIRDIDNMLESFWDAHEHRIADWYLAKKRSDDVIVSASPEFLLRPACDRLGIDRLLCSLVDKSTGRYSGMNCHGPEKVNRLQAAFGALEIDEFYSDSATDAPLAALARHSHMVRGDKIIPWGDYKPGWSSRLKARLLTPEFRKFLLVGLINTVNGIVLSYLFSLAVGANAAFFLGYVTTLTIAYFLTCRMVFRSKPSPVALLKFYASYIPNLIIQSLVVFVVYNCMGLHKLIAYIISTIIGIPVTFLAISLFAFRKQQD